MEALFWATAGTVRFADAGARAAYRAMWFGQYAPPWAWVGSGGYCIGAPATTAAPYLAALLPLIAAHPAHAHVNVAPSARGQGAGRALLGAFIAACRLHGVAGMHVTTAADSAAARFFAACGLRPLGGMAWQGRQLCVLGIATA